MCHNIHAFITIDDLGACIRPGVTCSNETAKERVLQLWKRHYKASITKKGTHWLGFLYSQCPFHYPADILQKSNETERLDAYWIAMELMSYSNKLWIENTWKIHGTDSYSAKIAYCALKGISIQAICERSSPWIWAREQLTVSSAVLIDLIANSERARPCNVTVINCALYVSLLTNAQAMGSVSNESAVFILQWWDHSNKALTQLANGRSRFIVCEPHYSSDEESRVVRHSRSGLWRVQSHLLIVIFLKLNYIILFNQIIICINTYFLLYFQ